MKNYANEMALRLIEAEQRIKELEKRIAELEKWNAEMVEKAASGGTLEGYREMGQRIAELEKSKDLAKSFHDLAVKERDYERIRNNRLEKRIAELTETIAFTPNADAKLVNENKRLDAVLVKALEYLQRPGTPYVNSAIAVLEEARAGE